MFENFLSKTLLEEIDKIQGKQTFDSAIQLVRLKIKCWREAEELDPLDEEVLMLPLDPKLKQCLLNLKTDDEIADCFSRLTMARKHVLGEGDPEQTCPY